MLISGMFEIPLYIKKIRWTHPLNRNRKWQDLFKSTAQSIPILQAKVKDHHISDWRECNFISSLTLEFLYNIHTAFSLSELSDDALFQLGFMRKLAVLLNQEMGGGDGGGALQEQEVKANLVREEPPFIHPPLLFWVIFYTHILLAQQPITPLVGKFS